MARWIKLETWAHTQYGDDAPDPRTLRRWAREGHLYPPAEQHGKCWYVAPDAKYSAHNSGSIIDRMKAVYGAAPA
jgi:predicted site-specific integrase-resolvase